MRDGFARAKSKPVRLEASSAKSRDIYGHFGFETRISAGSFTGDITCLITYLGKVGWIVMGCGPKVLKRQAFLNGSRRSWRRERNNGASSCLIAVAHRLDLFRRPPSQGIIATL
ncbi:uncharacterized protein BT62DRAFT_999485 [Guyanagaster necrorhizus]|uniref:Uncharacterized protein n=1 Tax=Guyanagaster necrorhizus TaxID=856835 RepID=A0A9P7W357_9AGAR|nr:uncharacterized protein BT62DRAFT_999485 [Guyanagaster necrorhizus MCA 3950]KAG7451787.1 hypothetical protein BT62DRAFT_999485 [Guyanagaster necrorhizus MCA 3950]